MIPATSDSGCWRGQLAYSKPELGRPSAANRENDHDAAEKRKNGPRVQQTTTFIVGHSVGRVAIARTICKEHVEEKEEEG